MADKAYESIFCTSLYKFSFFVKLIAKNVVHIARHSLVFKVLLQTEARPSIVVSAFVALTKPTVMLSTPAY